MKLNDIIGKKVLDKNAILIGKISDMDLDPIKGIINSFIISKNDLSLKQKIYLIFISDIDTIGDYMILNLEKNHIQDFKDNKTENKDKSKHKISID